MAIPFNGSTYSQNFDTLAQTGTNITWSNDSTIPGWYLFRQPVPGTPITAYNANDGSSNTGRFYSYGSTSSSDRALGGTASGNAYFGSPADGAVAGWIAFAATNTTGSTINSVTVNFNGEQWRNGGNTTPHTMVLEYGFGSSFGAVPTWTQPGGAFNWTSPVATATAAAVDGNTAGRVNNVGGTLSSLNWANGDTLWFRWIENNDVGTDHGLAIDDFSLSASTSSAGVTITESGSSTNVTEGGPTDTYTVVLNTAPTANVTIIINPGTQVTVSPSTLTFTPSNWNTPQTVTVTAVDDAIVEGNHTGTITHTASSTDTNYNSIAIPSVTVNITDNDLSITKIHAIQGNSSTQGTGGVHNDVSPLDGQTVTIEGIVTADFQLAATTPNNVRQLRGFFIQEETFDEDGDPTTSEGIFVFTGNDFLTNNLDVQEGQKVQVTGTVSEFFGMTQISATSVGSITVVNAGNNLSQITPATINFPIVGDIDDYYEQFEGMKVTFPDKLVVSEYFELARFGQIVLTANARPYQYTHIDNTPTAAEYAAFLDDLARKRIILDDDDNTQNSPLTDGVGKVFYPQPGGLSTGTQGVNFFRGGDSITGLTGVLHWSFAGASGTDAWRVRPTQANPIVFTVENPRPTTPPNVGGNIKVASFNILNYFTTIDTTGGSGSPRGADSTDEFNRQTDKLVQAIKGLNADVYGLMELENNGDAANGGAIKALVDALNLEANATIYDFVNTGKVGTDAITVGFIYKKDIVAPKGSFAVLNTPAFTDPNNTGVQRNRPAIAQTFEVIDSNNPDFGETFNVVVNHFKSKSSGTGAPADNDQNDGQGLSNDTRTKAAQALVAWLATDPTGQGDLDWLIIGDLNAYRGETPITTLKNAGYTDLSEQFTGPNAYSFVFNGQLGYLDYALANTALLPQVTGTAKWHINADEIPLFDYNDTIQDIPGESSFERKPAGNPLYEVNAFRTSDHDPVLVGLNLDSPIISFTTTTNAVEGGQNGVFNLTRTGPTTNPLVFNYTISSSSTATNGIDYTTLTGTAQFGAGNSTTTITVVAVDDAIAEPNETVILTLVDGVNYNLGANSTATVTITDNDTAGVIITESSGSTNIAEGGATDTYTVALQSQPTANVTITISPDSQSTTSATTLTFTPTNWNVAQTVTVTAVDDSIVEGIHTSTISHTATSTDPNYNNIIIPSVTANITDNDTAGVVITESSGSTNIAEGGATDTYTVALQSQPTANVTITISPDSQSTTSATSLTFTPTNWNVAQTVTVTAVNDSIAEGNHTSTITHTATSTDPNYNNIIIPSVTANITDNDTAGVVITESSGSTNIAEGGATDTYTVALQSQPTANVTITISPDSQSTTSATTLTFTPTNWNVAQTVTVTAVDDSIAEGNHTSTISHSASSTDSKYNGIAINTVTANITDNDVAGVVITESSGSTNIAEGGATDTYTVALKSQPTANVTITINPDSQSTTSATSLTFTPTNWNVGQTVTVTAVNDSIAEGNHTSTISHSASSADSKYNGIAINTVTANITDNDVAGVVITESSGSTNIAEGGATDTYTVALQSQPTANVTITISPDSQSTTSATTLTFTPTNWNVAQTVTVTAVDDNIVEGNHTSTISHTATSTDPNYNNIIIPSVTANVTDNDSNPPITPELTIFAPSQGVPEGEMATFTVKLSSISSNTVTVNFATANGTADAFDFTTASGILTFAPGETAKEIKVQTTKDSIDSIKERLDESVINLAIANQATVIVLEPTETFKVNLSSANNATILTGTATAEILDKSEGTPGNDLIVGLVGAANTLNGLGGNDILVGGNFSDVFNGGEGIDILLGGAGDDTMNGGEGNDIILSEAGNDLIVGEAGIDILYGGDGNDTIGGGDGNDVLVGEAGDDMLLGEAGDDYIDGGAGNDTIVGGAGDDGLLGRAGDDAILGGGGNDYMDGGDGNDYIEGDIGDDGLLGGAGNDVLLGGDGNDYLDGGAGNDVLIGGLGADGLVGGTGSDRFGFATNAPFNAAPIGNDIIADFNPADDFIVLSKTTFTAFTASSGSVFDGGTPIAAADFAVIGSGGATAAGASSALIVYETATGALFYNPDRATAGLGTGGQFATVSGAPTIPASRILIVS